VSGVQVSGQSDANEEVQVQENTQQEPVIEVPDVKPEPKRRGPNKPKPVEPEPDKDPEPAIGRIVQYVTRSGTIRPAIITAVSKFAVDLTVFNSTGAVPINGATFDAETPGDKPGTVFWPERN
jgi:hypothetical protein